jgi:hypothetical protein
LDEFEPVAERVVDEGALDAFELVVGLDLVAFLLARKSRSTPRWTFTAPASYQDPPRLRPGSGFSTSVRPRMSR